MYHQLRSIHRIVGVVCSLFLLLIALTGFFLATKSRATWIRPGEQEGGEVASMAQVISVDQALAAAYGVGIPELQESKHVDRVDYRPKRNVFKIVSREGYHEVQVCGKTGEVLQVAKRTDQWVEDLHDLSFFNDNLRDFLLPVVGVGLFGLSVSGLVIFTVPLYRRWKFRKLKATVAAKR